uniref:NADH-ubiquinone oxidoreductase chain 2 n=1 Tax=Metacrangonyx ilvanus TaxID=931575 RepID=K7ZVV9_9CRUS|nr:NADH dehydrogenase subunit 2 [Metacrangonyx ilvanus]CCI69546.1 NADH dehydrogenase subunit 2 [Metacrangonyx ilvanus]
MFLHPSLILFSFFLLFSVIMMICMNSWFLIWFFIEMNLLCFIPLILFKKNKYSVEGSLKYFFIQTVSSIFILIGLVLLFMDFEIYNYLFMSGLSIKLGFVPFHQWMVNIIESLTWPLVGVLFSLQKVGPFILFNYMYMMKNEIIHVMYMLSFLCALVGSLGGLFTSSMRKIMVFSSISHSAWLIMGMMVSIYMWIIYFVLYSLVLFSVLYILSSMNLSNLNHMFLKLNFFVSFSLGVGLLSMGGLPPLSGFVPKFILMKELILFYNYFVLLFLLMSVFISLFFYSRMFILNFIFLSNKNIFLKMSNNKLGIVLFINLMGMILIPYMIYFF